MPSKRAHAITVMSSRHVVGCLCQECTTTTIVKRCRSPTRACRSPRAAHRCSPPCAPSRVKVCPPPMSVDFCTAVRACVGGTNGIQGVQGVQGVQGAAGGGATGNGAILDFGAPLQPITVLGSLVSPQVALTPWARFLSIASAIPYPLAASISPLMVSTIVPTTRTISNPVLSVSLLAQVNVLNTNSAFTATLYLFPDNAPPTPTSVTATVNIGGNLLSLAAFTTVSAAGTGTVTVPAGMRVGVVLSQPTTVVYVSLVGVAEFSVNAT